MIFQLVTEKKLETIYFYPYHKGIDISTEGKMNESEKKEFEDGLADMWYDNEFIYRFTLYPQINNGVLEFEALNENDLVEFGSAREDWNFEELVKTIKIDLAEQIDCEINVDDLALNIDGSGYPSIELNNYDLKYYKAGVKKPIVLSKNEEIKSKIINYVEHWAVNNLFNCKIWV